VEKKAFADVWGDTVNLRHLAIGMILGIVVSLSCYIIGLKVIQANYPKLAANLMTGYALLVGIGGCLLSAVVTANLFKPKRTLNEEDFSEDDRALVLNELQVDRAREAEELKLASPAIIEEMKDLKLYDLFAGKTDSKKVGA
jgi:hypothetical protein